MRESEKPKVRFFHMRAENGKRGCTVAYIVTPDTKRAVYRVSRCNPKDNFCYRIGRQIAEGRLAKHGPEGEITYESFDDIKKHFIKMFHPDYFEAVEDKPKGFVGSVAAKASDPVIQDHGVYY